MKTPIITGLIAALVWIAIKWGGYAFGFFNNGAVQPYVFANMFLLTASVSIGLYLIKKNAKQKSNLLLDIKTGMTAAMPYTVIVSGFIFIFYTYINPEFNQKQLERTRISLQDKKVLTSLRNSNPTLENKTDQELLKEGMKQTRQIISPQFTMLVSLLGLLVYGTMNSLVISLIYRSLIFRNQRDEPLIEEIKE
jgi:hypothetical protein